MGKEKRGWVVGIKFLEKINQPIYLEDWGWFIQSKLNQNNLIYPSKKTKNNEKVKKHTTSSINCPNNKTSIHINLNAANFFYLHLGQV